MLARNKLINNKILKILCTFVREVVDSRQELLGPGVEGRGVLPEVLYLKDGLGIRQVVPGQIRIEAGRGGPEVRNAAGRAQPGAGHHHNLLACRDCFTDGLQGAVDIFRPASR